ncbi:hypothetical protein CCR75_006334 [Bremia lactucae]|uniref:Uncharacterized protein n=1 Tax=Bremia lactucae TaxID=4779 RepID=A0A976FRP7_BRELC|nr:hypothetical protein CCR75_006334 [Bremia lactucae]
MLNLRDIYVTSDEKSSMSSYSKALRSEIGLRKEGRHVRLRCFEYAAVPALKLGNRAVVMHLILIVEERHIGVSHSIRSASFTDTNEGFFFDDYKCPILTNILHYELYSSNARQIVGSEWQSPFGQYRTSSPSSVPMVCFLFKCALVAFAAAAATAEEEVPNPLFVALQANNDIGDITVEANPNLTPANSNAQSLSSPFETTTTAAISDSISNVTTEMELPPETPDDADGSDNSVSDADSPAPSVTSSASTDVTAFSVALASLTTVVRRIVLTLTTKGSQSMCVNQLSVVISACIYSLFNSKINEFYTQFTTSPAIAKATAITVVDIDEAAELALAESDELSVLFLVSIRRLLVAFETLETSSSVVPAALAVALRAELVASLTSFVTELIAEFVAFVAASVAPFTTPLSAFVAVLVTESAALSTRASSTLSSAATTAAKAMKAMQDKTRIICLMQMKVVLACKVGNDERKKPFLALATRKGAERSRKGFEARSGTKSVKLVYLESQKWS